MQFWLSLAANNGHEKAMDRVNGFGNAIDKDTMKPAKGILNCLDSLVLTKRH